MLFDIRSVLRVMMAMTYFFFGNNFIYLFLAVLDLCCDTGFPPAVVREDSSVAVCRRHPAPAPLVEQRPWGAADSVVAAGGSVAAASRL